MVKPITRQELKSRLDLGEPITIVEALSPMQFEDAHLPGAKNLPPDLVDELAPTLLPDKTATIVVYCANTACQASVGVSRRLVVLGYENVLEYVEGKQDWIEAGYPVESGAIAA